jgi:hypothetical protein
MMTVLLAGDAARELPAIERRGCPIRIRDQRPKAQVTERLACLRPVRAIARFDRM